LEDGIANLQTWQGGATRDSIESLLNWSKDQCLVESPIWIHCGCDIPEMMFSGSNPDNPSQH